MMIEEYLNRIEILRNEKNEIAYPNDVDLEFYIQQIKQINTEPSFAVDALFEKTTSGIMIVGDEVIRIFTDHLGLLFIDKKEFGNVCFANSEELRLEYRQSFRLMDLLDYVCAFMLSSIYKKSERIIVSSDTALFWELVKISRSLREGNK